MANTNMGERIKKIRLKLGKNQEEFGKLFDPPAPKSAVSRWEHGGNPNKKRLKKISELGDVSVDYLVNGVTASNIELKKILDNFDRKQKKISKNDKRKLWEHILESEIDSDKRIEMLKQQFKNNLKRFTESPFAFAGYGMFNNFFEVFNYIVKNGTVEEMSDLEKISEIIKTLVIYDSTSLNENTSINTINKLLKEMVEMKNNL